MANVIVEKDPSAVVDLHQNSWMADISKADNSTQPLLRGDPYLVEAVERGAILVGRCVSPDPEELFQENISDTTSLVSSHPEWNDSEAAISPHTASTAATPGLADRKDSPLDKLWENLETDSATSNDFLPRDCLQCELKDETWSEKLGLRARLLDEEQKRTERTNWILPRILDPRKHSFIRKGVQARENLPLPENSRTRASAIRWRPQSEKDWLEELILEQTEQPSTWYTFVVNLMYLRL
ncbi:hypothetical protein H2203_005856 [Taxawa tesnikishii (nom. ined.)]|nr:hypothetical protein H2203_005856 [Dothideales sp. JES 119]